MSVGESFKILAQNKYFILVGILFVLNYTAGGATNGAGVYYASYVLGDTNLFGNLILFGMVPCMGAVFVLPKLSEKIGKWKVMLGSFVIQIIAYALIGMFPANLPVLYAALAWGNYDGLAAVQPASAITAITALYSYIPLVLIVITTVVMYFTNVDKDIAKLKGSK